MAMYGPSAQSKVLTPLCGFSQIINKYADGGGGALTYEVHTPKPGLSEVGLTHVSHMFDSCLTRKMYESWSMVWRLCWPLGRKHTADSVFT
jgi:hypothetical protein